MSGIFAAIWWGSEPADPDVVARLERKMKLFPWQIVQRLDGPGDDPILGVRVNRPGQLDEFAFQQGAVRCVLAGSLQASSGVGSRDDLRHGRYAELVTRAYLAQGAAFPASLSGPFLTAIHDHSKDRLVLATGRQGISQLYIYHDAHVFLVATQLAALAGCGAFPVVPDARAIGQLLAYGQVFGTSTLVEQVQVLPTATAVVVDLSRRSVAQRRYWTLASLGEPKAGLTFRQHVEELSEVITGAADRMVVRDGRYFSGLSGGLDSRLVTALAAARRPVTAWTFGAAQSTDLVTAAEVCRALRIDHRQYAVDPQLIGDQAAVFADTVDGAVRIDFAFSLVRARDLMNDADIVLNGFFGDSILGGALLGPRLSVLKNELRHGTWLTAARVHPLLAHNRRNPQIASYLATKYGKPSHLVPLAACPAVPLAQIILEHLEADLRHVPVDFRAEQWVLDNRAARWTVMGIVSDRHFFADGSVFYDDDVVARSLATPQKFRREHRIYGAVLQRLLPQMAAIPNGNTGRLPTQPPLWSVLEKTGARLARVANRQAPPPSTGSDPNTWARTVCREYYRSLLGDRMTRERSFWDGVGIARLAERHFSGQVQAAAELAVVASVEEFFRRVEGDDR